MDAEVLVIGGGYAGLSTGALLARSGISVILLERAPFLGGRASYTERDGFLLEYGLHDNRFAADGAAAAVFRELGKEIEFIEPGEPELWLEGGFVPLLAGVASVVSSRLLSPAEKLSAARHLSRLALKRPSRLYDISLEHFLSGCRSPRVKDLFSILSGIGIIAPDLREASAGEFAAFLRKALRSRSSVGYPRGGTRSIIEGLRQALEENGRVVTGAGVEGLSLQKGKVVEVRTRDAAWRAEAVVSAVPVQQLPGLFGRRDLPTRFLEAAEGLVPTAGISLDLALRAPVSGRRGLLVTADPLSMGQFTSNLDPEVAPPGKQLLSWFLPLPRATVEDSGACGAEEEKLRELLGRMFPGLWERVEWERVMRLRMVDGFLPSPSQSLPHRPGFRVEGIDNLFVAGDGTAAEGTGGDAAFNSARKVSSLVREYLAAAG